MDGKLAKLVLYVECLICRHVGGILQAKSGSRVLPADLKPSLRCSQCGAVGEVEVLLGWSSGEIALKGARNDRDARASET